MARYLLIAGLLCCTAGIAQVDSNSVTVAVSRATMLPPDQVVFNISVTAPITAGLEDVLAQLAGTGVTAADLQTSPGFYPVIPSSIPLQSAAALPVVWDFRLGAPLAKIKDTIANLVAVQKKLGNISNNAGSGPVLSFNVSGLRTSNSQTCSPADLLSDARAQAQKIADAAGMTLGPVLAISTAVSSPTSAGAGLADFLLGSVATSSTQCSAIVKFAATRVQ